MGLGWGRMAKFYPMLCPVSHAASLMVGLPRVCPSWSGSGFWRRLRRERAQRLGHTGLPPFSYIAHWPRKMATPPVVRMGRST